MATKLGQQQDSDLVQRWKNAFQAKEEAPADPLKPTMTPKMRDYYNRQYAKFKYTGELEPYRSPEEIEAMQPEPVEQTSSIGRGVSNLADFAEFAVFENPEAIKRIHETAQTIPAESQFWRQGLGQKSEDIAEAEGFKETMGAATDWIKYAADSPGEVASVVGENLAMSAGALAGLKAGATAGATFGPIGAAIGGALGMFAGGFTTDYIAEKASNVASKVKDPTNIQEVRKAIEDTGLMAEIEAQAGSHAMGVAAVDAAVGLLTGGLIAGTSRGVRTANRLNQQATRAQRIRQGVGTGAAFGLELAGEPLGEAVGQQLAYGEIDPAEVGLEAVGGIGQSLGTVALMSPIQAVTKPMNEAQKLAERKRRINPNREFTPDYSKALDPITGDKLENKDIAKSAYKITKFLNAREGTPAHQIALDNVRQLIDKYVVGDNIDVNDKNEAQNVLVGLRLNNLITPIREEFEAAKAANEAKTENKQSVEEIKKNLIDKYIKKHIFNPDAGLEPRKRLKDSINDLVAGPQNLPIPKKPRAQGPRQLKQKTGGRTYNIVMNPEEIKTVKTLDKHFGRFQQYADAYMKDNNLQTLPDELEAVRQAYEFRKTVLDQAEAAAANPPTEQEQRIATIDKAVRTVQGGPKEVAGFTQLDQNWENYLANDETYDPKVAREILEAAGIAEQVYNRVEEPFIQDLTAEEQIAIDNVFSRSDAAAQERQERLLGTTNQKEVIREGQKLNKKEAAKAAKAEAKAKEQAKITEETGAVSRVYKSVEGAKKALTRDFNPETHIVRTIDKEGTKFAIYPKESNKGYAILKKSRGAPKKGERKPKKSRYVINQEFPVLQRDGEPVYSLVNKTPATGYMKWNDQAELEMELEDGSWVSFKEYTGSKRIPSSIRTVSPKVAPETLADTTKTVEVEDNAATVDEQERKTSEAVRSIQQKNNSHLQNLHPEWIKYIITEAKNIASIVDGNIRANIIEKITEHLSTSLGEPVTVADITNFVYAYPDIANQIVASGGRPEVPTVDPHSDPAISPTPEQSPTIEDISPGSNEEGYKTSMADALKAAKAAIEPATEPTPTSPAPTTATAPEGQQAATEALTLTKPVEQELKDTAAEIIAEAAQSDTKFVKSLNAKVESGDLAPNTVIQIEDETYVWNPTNEDWRDGYDMYDTQDREDFWLDYYSSLEELTLEDRIRILNEHSKLAKDYNKKAEEVRKKKAEGEDEAVALQQDNTIDQLDNISETGITPFTADSTNEEGPQATAGRINPRLRELYNNKVGRMAKTARDWTNKIQSDDLDVIVVTKESDLDKYPKIKDLIFGGKEIDEINNRSLQYSTALGVHFKEGQYGNDKTVVLAFPDRYTDFTSFKETMYHEIVGHYGVRKLLDKEWYNFLDKAVLTNKKARDTAYNYSQRWAKHILVKNKLTGNYTDYKNANGEIVPFTMTMPKKGYVKIRDGLYANQETMRKLMDEYIAEEATKFVNRDPSQSMKQQNFIKRIIAWIRHKLRTVVYPEFASEVTDNDIAKLLEESWLRNIVKPSDYVSVEEQANRLTNIADKKYTTWENTIRSKRGPKPPSVVEILTDKIQEIDPTYQLQMAKDTGSVVNYIANPNPELDFPQSAMARVEGFSATTIEDVIDTISVKESQQKMVNTIRTAVDNLGFKLRAMPILRHLSTYEGAARERELDTLLRISRGRIQQAEKKIHPLFKWMTKVDKVTRDRIIDAWINNEDFAVVPGLNKIQRNQLVAARNAVEQAQLTFNNIILNPEESNPDSIRKMLPDEWLERNQGTFLHTMFTAYINESAGSGKAPSRMNYFKKKVANPTLQAALGKIENPALAIPYTATLLVRDAAISRLLQDIVENSSKFDTGWVLTGRKTYPVPGLNMYNGKTKRYTLTALKGTIERIVRNLNNEDALQTKEESREKLEQDLETLTTAYDQVKDEEIQIVKDAMIKSGHKDPTDDEAVAYLANEYVWVTPKSHPNLVPLHNKYVHKAIFTEFAADNQDFDFETGGFARKAWRDVAQRGGFMEKGTQIWKQSKTGFNIPTYWIRNAIGNWYLLDTASATPSHTIMGYLNKEIKNTFFTDNNKAEKWGDKTMKEWADEFGLYSTTYGATELYFLRDKYMDWVKQEEARKSGNMWKLMGLNISTSFLKFSEAIADYHGVLEGIFKQAAMRDYIGRYEKQNGVKFNNINDARAQKALMAAAAEFAENAIFDYQKVPLWVKRLRRAPIGTPFLTFNYKMASQLPKAMLKHPWKLAKYYVMPSMILSAAFSDLSDEDWDEIRKTMPLYMRNHSSAFVVPIKNDEGSFSYYDMTYNWPPSMFIDMPMKVFNPQMGETWYGNTLNMTTNELGFLGGPVPQMLAASLTNKDPFSGRDIWQEGAPIQDNIDRFSTWLYTLWMPTSISEYGLLGRSLNQAGIDMPLVSSGEYLNKYGTDKESIADTLWRGAGVIAGKIKPQDTATTIQKTYRYKLNQLLTNRRKDWNNQNKNKEEKIALMKEYALKIKELQRQYTIAR